MRWPTRASMSFGAFRVHGIVRIGRGKAMARGIRALLPLWKTATRAGAAYSREDAVFSKSHCARHKPDLGVTGKYMESFISKRGSKILKINLAEVVDSGKMWDILRLGSTRFSNLKIWKSCGAQKVVRAGLFPKFRSFLCSESQDLEILKSFEQWP